MSAKPPAPAARSSAADDTIGAIQSAISLAMRLRPDWQRPERFHEAKSELIAALRAVAAQPVLVRNVVRSLRVEVPIYIQPPPKRRRGRHRFPLPSPGNGSGRLF